MYGFPFRLIFQKSANVALWIDMDPDDPDLGDLELITIAEPTVPPLFHGRRDDKPHICFTEWTGAQLG